MSVPKGTKNIGGDSHDSFYRYKRSVIEVKYGKKKGGTTEIMNMHHIQAQLGVPEGFVKKFYKVVKKTGKAMTKSGVFRGTIEVEFFEEVLDAMIQKYILCPQCGSPEWRSTRCDACGYQ